MSAGALPQTPLGRDYSAPDPLARFKGSLHGRSGLEAEQREGLADGKTGLGRGRRDGKGDKKVQQS